MHSAVQRPAFGRPCYHAFGVVPREAGAAIWCRPEYGGNLEALNGVDNPCAAQLSWGEVGEEDPLR